ILRMVAFGNESYQLFGDGFLGSQRQIGVAAVPADEKRVIVVFEPALIPSDPVSGHHVQRFGGQLFSSVVFEVVGLGGKPYGERALRRSADGAQYVLGLAQS